MPNAIRTGGWTVWREKEAFNDGVFYQQIKSKNIICAEYLSSRSDAATGRMKKLYKVARPGGWQSHLLAEDELSEKYVPVTLEQRKTFKDEQVMSVSDWWKAEVAATPATQTHTHHLITGAVLPV